VTTLHDLGSVSGRSWDTFLLGSHNFVVMALGSCVKWPLVQLLPVALDDGGVGHTTQNMIFSV